MSLAAGRESSGTFGGRTEYKRRPGGRGTRSVSRQPFNMEQQSQNQQQQLQVRQIVDPRVQYTALKNLETYYWNCIDSYWSMLSNPDAGKMEGIIQQQIKMNRQLMRLHNELKITVAANSFGVEHPEAIMPVYAPPMPSMPEASVQVPEMYGGVRNYNEVDEVDADVVLEKPARRKRQDKADSQ